MTRAWVFIGIAAIGGPVALAQSGTPYYAITTVAGSYPLGDGGPATEALLLSPQGVAVDAVGNLYIADTAQNRVRSVSRSGLIVTIAGTGRCCAQSGDGGPAAQAELDEPFGVAFDRSGNLYIAESSRIRRVSPAGQIVTVAGGALRGFGGDGGPVVSAQLMFPAGLAFDGSGNLYLADRGNYRIRKVAPDGVITTVAGTGAVGFSGDGGPATAARLDWPTDVAVDAAGNLYIADSRNHRIRRVSPSGIIQTIAGDGVQGLSGDGGPAAFAQLSLPSGVDVDSGGNLYIADSGNNVIRRVVAGQISRVAGTSGLGFGGDGGPALSALLLNPIGLAVDTAGSVYIADLNHRIRRVTSAGIITTVAGRGHFSGDGGPATAGVLFRPAGVAVDVAGNLYFADASNHRVRKVTSSGILSTVAGTGVFSWGGDGGPGALAHLNAPEDVAVDAGQNVYIADQANNLIRKVTPAGIISTFAGSGPYGFFGDGGQATAARLGCPSGVAADRQGNVYIADTCNDRIRKVLPNGVIGTVAGNGVKGFGGDNGPAVLAQLAFPCSVAVDAVGNLYISDWFNQRIRRVTPSGVISTVAGTGGVGFSGDGGPAVAAQLHNPRGVAVDAAGNLYIADWQSHRIRRVDTAGRISTIAGSLSPGFFPGFSGDGGLAVVAELNSPRGVAADASGSIYIADGENHRIRRLTILTPASLSIFSGDRQSAPIGAPAPAPLAVKVASSSLVPVPGIPVTFAVTSGSARLSATSAVTGIDGTASVQLTFGSTVGAVTVTASVGGLLPVRFTLVAGARVFSGGVVGAGLSVPSVQTIAPNGIISIFGEGFVPAGTRYLVGAEDLVDGRLPTKWGGVCVEIGSARAAMFHVFPTQLNVQVPTLAGSGSVRVQVILNCGEANEVRSNEELVPLRPAAPEFFFFATNPDGINPIRAVNALTGALVGPADASGVTTPARPGDLVLLFATGLGLTEPRFAAGQLPDRAAGVLETVRVTMGGVDLSGEDVLYAGVTPFFAGLYQVSIRIPAGAAAGNLPVSLRVGGASTPPGGFLAVGSAVGK